MKPVFSLDKSVIGMIHVRALPGTPRYAGDMRAIIAKAQEEARVYADAGLDAIAIENMHDTPYLKGAVGPEITAAMTAVASAVGQACALPCGIQVLAGANRAALAVALAADLQFVRAEGFVFAHVADEGVIESCAGDLLRYRKSIGAEPIQVWCDIKKKHCSHAITEDVDIGETAKAAEFFLSDGIIVTGVATGAAADIADIRAVRARCKLPVLVGSGVDIANVDKYLALADGVIVGSSFKEKGHWAGEISASQVADFMKRVRGLRNGGMG